MAEMRQMLNKVTALTQSNRLVYFNHAVHLDFLFLHFGK